METKAFLRPVELSILETAIEMRVRGVSRFHGFTIASEIKARRQTRFLMAHGTLYKALDRLRKLEFLESEWEDPLVAANETRPRRRFYWITMAGEAALARGREGQPVAVPERQRGLAAQ